MSDIDKQALRINAQLASSGKWIKESGDGWEAICSSDDQANAGFIVAHFEGPDAKENREFIQAANPVTVLALLDELEAETSYREGAFIACNRWHDKFRESEAKLEAAEKRIAELSHHLQCAHGFIEHTEAFGHEASNGILCCGDAQWNIDASKSVLAAAGKGE